ncbi:hypothetical protein [Xylella fastidiosa]|uniref:hypothetical protein n=1 Tax=Xylella fastidiosa TaxID=2371 RepID=UPI00398484A7
MARICFGKSLPRPPDSQYTVSTDMLKIGNFMIQWGRDTGPRERQSGHLKLVTFEATREYPIFVKSQRHRKACNS